MSGAAGFLGCAGRAGGVNLTVPVLSVARRKMMWLEVAFVLMSAAALLAYWLGVMAGRR
jgi:hypothetical protein